jgi:Ricin-type beta-trefoil lectin domain
VTECRRRSDGKEKVLAPNSESGGDPEPLGVRRQVELPEVNTEAAGDLTPASDTRPKTETDRPETGSAAEDAGDSRPEGATASSEKEEQPALARGVAVAAPREAKGAVTTSKRHVAVAAGRPTGPRFATVTRLLLKNVMTGLCADVPGYGDGDLDTPVQQFTCDGSSHDNQQWDLVVNDKGGGPNGADLFTIRNSRDDHCADLPGTGAVDHGTHVTEYLCYPGRTDNQMWYLVKKSKNTFWIRNHASHKDCLDVLGTDGSGGKDAALTLWPCDSKDDHLWAFK